VIEAPASRFVNAGGKLAIEPQLILRLLEDIDKSAAATRCLCSLSPSSQLVLEYRRAGALRLENYGEFGGLRGAISAAVERAFARADAEPQRGRADGRSSPKGDQRHRPRGGPRATGAAKMASLSRR
jgi:hypothetical protein